MTQQESQAKFVEWQQMTQQLEALKEREMQLRLELVEAYFPNRGDEGTDTLTLGEGWKLQCVSRVTRSLANSKGETEAIAKQLPPEVADSVIEWKPSLKKRGYTAMQPEYRALIDGVLTTKPGTPSLKLVAPKGA